jgi:hypothetical protein
MSGPIDPISGARPPRRVAERRRASRRDGDRRAKSADAKTPNLPVPVAPRDDPKAAPPPGPGVFAAQVLGQGGEKRGLKGGPPVLEGARSAYLQAEFLGPNDRRTRKGRITKTEI